MAPEELSWLHSSTEDIGRQLKNMKRRIRIAVFINPCKLRVRGNVINQTFQHNSASLFVNGDITVWRCSKRTVNIAAFMRTVSITSHTPAFVVITIQVEWTVIIYRMCVSHARLSSTLEQMTKRLPVNDVSNEMDNLHISCVFILRK